VFSQNNSSMPISAALLLQSVLQATTMPRPTAHMMALVPNREQHRPPTEYSEPLFSSAQVCLLLAPCSTPIPC